MQDDVISVGSFSTLLVFSSFWLLVFCCSSLFAVRLLFFVAFEDAGLVCCLWVFVCGRFAVGVKAFGCWLLPVACCLFVLLLLLLFVVDAAAAVCFVVAAAAVVVVFV